VIADPRPADVIEREDAYERGYSAAEAGGKRRNPYGGWDGVVEPQSLARFLAWEEGFDSCKTAKAADKEEDSWL